MCGMFVTDDVVVAVSNSGLVKVWTIHDANDTRLVCMKLVILHLHKNHFAASEFAV